MNNFYFREMLLVSFRERKARRVVFHPRVTVVRGENETGKSSLLKSLFFGLGATPARMHPSWLRGEVRILIKFDVGQQSYSVLRHGDAFALFDANNRLLGHFRSVTDELAPFLSEIFNFGLRLPDRERRFRPLPPAYLFLPFYMDQDASWTSGWSAFKNLQQFANWKKGVVEYHAGIRGNKYYEAQAVKLDAEVALSKVTRKREGLSQVYDSLRDRFDAAQFDVNFAGYQQEVEELLMECEKLRKLQEGYKARLSEMRASRDVVKSQLDITNHAREEARLDHDYAAHAGDEVQCPTCGAGYENSFAERFSIAMDEDRCADLALRLVSELSDLDNEIAQELRDAQSISEKVEEVERLLARREGEIALGDLIRQAGKRELRDVMSLDLAALESEEQRFDAAIQRYSDEMRRQDSRDQRKQINTFFDELMGTFLIELDALSVNRLKRVDSSVNATGSELPRALLAYQVAFFHILRRYGSAASGPLVVDSPLQQDQDERHAERIFRFLGRRCPEGTQLIVGTVDTAGVDLGGDEIVLDRKYSLLREEDFDSVSAEVTAYLDTALRSR